MIDVAWPRTAARVALVEAQADGPVAVNKGVADDGIIGGMVPEQDGGVPKVRRAVGGVEILEKVIADEPVAAGVDVDALRITRAAAMVERRWGHGVADGAILHAGIGHAAARRARVALDHLLAGIEEVVVVDGYPVGAGVSL